MVEGEMSELEGVHGIKVEVEDRPSGFPFEEKNLSPMLVGVRPEEVVEIVFPNDFPGNFFS